MNYLLETVVDNNSHEGYATMLIDHEKKIVYFNAYGIELQTKFKKEIFRTSSIDGRYSTNIHICDYISDYFKEWANEQYPGFAVK